MDLSFVTERDATQVAGFHLGQTDVDDLGVVVSANLSDHVRLAHAGGAPEHDRGVVTCAGTVEFAFEYD
jgi:hypothetical protein